MERALSAPGKLFLSGEYAVLWGGVARVAAVGPRTNALVRRRADREVHLALEEGRFKGQATPLGVNWEGEVPRPFLFAARALDLSFRAHGRESPGLDLAISPTPSFGGTKLGVGGSARAAVLSAEAARYVLEGRWDALKLSLLAHLVAQGGLGSGADVAASFAGGVIRYRRFPLAELTTASVSGQLEAALTASPPVEVWRLPGLKVSLGYAFAGESAPTERMVAMVERGIEPAARAELVSKSDEQGRLLEEAMVRGDFEGVRAAAGELERLIAALGPLETEAHRRVIALSESYGCAAKISGAGAGDGCVLFAPGPQALRFLIDALTERGIYAVPLDVEPGLRGEPRADERLVGWLR
ncbi:MAG: phosphomevalonate kinase [Myxococcales bacterium]|nr:phosphomevalonate kinase [Myxococcales bacterium]